MINETINENNLIDEFEIDEEMLLSFDVLCMSVI